MVPVVPVVAVNAVEGRDVGARLEDFADVVVVSGELARVGRGEVSVV